MKKKISVNDCKSMFSDKFSSLSMKEIGIELKHFSMGTAPENPSFLVNQDDLKKKIIDKFCNFFDETKAQGLEVIFLKSNYGNGKSHFIRTIYTFLSDYENVIVRKVSLKQEETDLKKKILDSVSQKVLKECAVFLVESAEKDALSLDKHSVIMAAIEKYSIDAYLAGILYEVARSNEISLQVQAIAILKGNYLPEYLKNFGIKKKELSSEFYYNVIKLVSIYLKEISYYLVIVFDEYEHVFSWKSEKDRKNLYEDIKLFTDNIDTFGNLFFVFAESDSVSNESESSDDPAFKSRKANLTYQIADISSQNEVDKLFRMILKRYEKYYEISFDAYIDDILQMVYEDPLIKEKTHYRAYTQAIMRALDQFRNKPPKLKKIKKSSKQTNEKVEFQKLQVDEILKNKLEKWEKSTSISKKTLLCEMFQKMLQDVGENVVDIRKKQGEISVGLGDERKRILIITTDNPSEKDLTKRISNLSLAFKETIIVYPALNKEADIDMNEKMRVIFYNDETVEATLHAVYDSNLCFENIEAYLAILDKRGKNAEDRSC